MDWTEDEIQRLILQIAATQEKIAEKDFEITDIQEMIANISTQIQAVLSSSGHMAQRSRASKRPGLANRAANLEGELRSYEQRRETLANENRLLWEKAEELRARLREMELERESTASNQTGYFRSR